MQRGLTLTDLADRLLYGSVLGMHNSRVLSAHHFMVPVGVAEIAHSLAEFKVGRSKLKLRLRSLRLVG